MLDDEVNTSVEEELTAAFEDLGEDQLAEVLAFCWVGQGTYDASDWDEAMEEASELIDARSRDRGTAGHADAGLGARSRDGGVRSELRRDRRPQLAPAKGIERQASPTGRRGSGGADSRGDRQRRGREARAPAASSSALRLARGDLVLDRDVRPPAVRVLRASARRGNGRRARSRTRSRSSDTIREGDPAAEVHQPGDIGARRRLARRLGQSAAAASASSDGGSAWNMVRCAGS